MNFWKPERLLSSMGSERRGFEILGLCCIGVDVKGRLRLRLTTLLRSNCDLLLGSGEETAGEEMGSTRSRYCTLSNDN